MATKFESAMERAAIRVQEQEAWIERCGGSLAGYVENYGVPGTYREVTYRGRQYTVPAWSGNGGEAIYEADMARLRQLRELWVSLARRRRR